MKPHESSIGVSGDPNPGALRVGLQHPSPRLSLAETRCGGSRRRAQPRRRTAGSRAGTPLPPQPHTAAPGPGSSPVLVASAERLSPAPPPPGDPRHRCH